MYNTIILKKGCVKLPADEFKNFSEGNTILGVCGKAKEICRWNIKDEAAAKEELSKHRCTCQVYEEMDGSVYGDIEEYVLEYCKCNEDNKFSSDFVFANKLTIREIIANDIIDIRDIDVITVQNKIGGEILYIKSKYIGDFISEVILDYLDNKILRHGYGYGLYQIRLS